MRQSDSTHSLKNFIVQDEFEDKANKAHIKEEITINDFVNDWENEFTKRIKTATNSRKRNFTLTDALHDSEGYRNERDEVFIAYNNYVNSDPLRKNDYYRYLSSYKKGKKLNDNYFKHDLNLLHQAYKKFDVNQKNIGFSELAWKRYVLYMLFKFKGLYDPNDPKLDLIFRVNKIKNREYNPVTQISRHLRGVLPPSLKLVEFDIMRANPTFIDLELKMDRTEDIYQIIDKVRFNMLVNTHKGNKNASINDVRNKLKPIYGDLVSQVITDDRFNNKGRMFEDLTKVEAQYIEKFVKENNLTYYVRLHDAVIVPSNVEIKTTEFGKVKFKANDIRPPEVINLRRTFYSYDDKGKLLTTSNLYKDFFQQENFVRVTEQDNDQITIFKDSNKVVKPFNYRTDTLPYLSKHINEPDVSEIENRIAKDNHRTIYGGYLLMEAIPLVYYCDTAETFGLSFKNGFYLYTKENNKVTMLQYKDVDGFFALHETQKHKFEPNEEPEMCEFQRFLALVSTRKDPKKELLSDEEQKIADSFYRMFGYLCHTHKNPAFCPAIILSDEGADDENRNGGRGKSLIGKAVEKVQKIKIKGGNEFDGNYRHRFADLERAHKVYIVDDVPAGFKYDDIYTNVTNDITCERKGKTAETIPFKEAPKFLFTTNWAVRHNIEATSTNRRLLEYQLTNFFNLTNTPYSYFEQHFFEDWDAAEWNRFYNFVFRCAADFIKNGLSAPVYDKHKDNFNAVFYNDAILEEFERIFNILNSKDDFSVNDFLTIYKDPTNPLKFEGYFNHIKLKNMINTYIQYKKLNITYRQRDKRWLNNDYYADF